MSASKGKSCHDQGRIDVGIRGLMVLNLAKSERILYFRNRLRDQSANWSRNDGFFDRLKQTPGATGGLLFIWGVNVQYPLGSPVGSGDSATPMRPQLMEYRRTVVRPYGVIGSFLREASGTPPSTEGVIGRGQACKNRTNYTL